MSYLSPLSLLNEEQLAAFKPENIKKIRSELLLQFQLSSEPTIILQNQPFDKDEILQLLEQLQADPDLHLSIFNNKPLLGFLEEGKTEFFISKTAQVKVLTDPVRSFQLNTLIVDAINEILPEWILPIGHETTAFLKNVYAYVRQLEPSLQEIAYSGTYEKIRSIVNMLTVTYADPFSTPISTEVTFELKLFVMQEFVAYFKHLPKAFENLRRQYCIWCNNSIVSGFSHRKEPLSQFHRYTLHVVMEAAIIASAEFNKEGNLKIAEQLDNYLSGGTQVAKGSSSSSEWRVIISVITGIISLLLMCSRMDRQKNRNSYGDRYRSSTNYTYDQQQKKVVPYDANARNTNTKAAPVKMSPGHFNGSAKMNKKFYQVKDIKETHDRTTVIYEAEVIPFYFGSFNEFVPASVEKKHAESRANIVRPITLVFQKKGLPEIRFSHELNINFQMDKKLVSSSSQTGSGKLAVYLPDELNTYEFKGFATQMDTSGRIIGRDTLKVWKTNANEIPFMQNNGEIVIAGNNLQNDKANSLRLKYLVHNIELFKHQLLSGTGNEVKQLWLYEFDAVISGAKKEVEAIKITKIYEKNSPLYFLFTSSIDKIAYYTLSEGKSDFKFMFDTSTGLLKGIQVATMSNSGTVIDRLELFRIEKGKVKSSPSG